MRFTVTLLAALALPVVAAAQATEAPAIPQLEYRTGTIPLGDGLATIELGDDLRYLSPAETDRVLQAWGNPPDPNTLGMLVPADRGPFEMDGWAVVVTHAADGYVEDDDADDLDYDALLEELQEMTREGNERRRALGLSELRLVGWAEPPHYDASAHQLYWAQDLEAENPDGTKQRDVNYAVRILGRRGVLELNAIASLGQLPEMRAKMRDILPRVRYEPGHRYADFDPDVDEVAAYGLGALILGKIASKTGILALIGAFFLKAWKLILVALAGMLAFFKRLFGRKREGEDEVSEDEACSGDAAPSPRG
jgi:uncharacterized membrane-anchored protein